MKDKKSARAELISSFSILKESPIPKGFAQSCEDIDIDIFEFDGYIAGIVTKYLSGEVIEVENINLGEDLFTKISVCEQHFLELKKYLDLLRTVCRNLLACLNA